LAHFDVRSAHTFRRKPGLLDNI